MKQKSDSFLKHEKLVFFLKITPKFLVENVGSDYLCFASFMSRYFYKILQHIFFINIAAFPSPKNSLKTKSWLHQWRKTMFLPCFFNNKTVILLVLHVSLKEYHIAHVWSLFLAVIFSYYRRRFMLLWLVNVDHCCSASHFYLISPQHRLRYYW